MFLPGPRARSLSLGSRFAVVSLCLASLLSVACEKVPLLAPSGSTIILTASTTALPANGTADLVAQILEAAGTPPHSGTHVIFTTTLGVIEPAEAVTDINGRVTVKFKANGANGTATITAASGGATTGANGAVKIAVGTAAAGRITLTANPSTISANGGVAAIIANVVDINGNVLVGAPVSFATSAGALGSSLVSTDENGNAQTTLTTAVEATVTATVGLSGTGTGTGGTGTPAPSATSATVTVKVNPLPTVSISPQSGTLTAGSPIVFTLNVAAGTNSTAQIREVTVDFGDGRRENLGGVSGTITVQHTYDDGRSYTVRATATDTLGGSNSGATVIVVQPQPPFGVSISKASSPAGTNTNYTLTATVTPPSVVVTNYLWTRDGGTFVQSGSSNQLLVTFPTGEAHTITVQATTTTGAQTSASVFLP